MPLSPLARLVVTALLAPALWLSAADARAATINELLAGSSLEAGGLRIGVVSTSINSRVENNQISFDVLTVSATSVPGFVTIDVIAPGGVRIGPGESYVGRFRLAVEALPRDLGIGDVELRFLDGNSTLGRSLLDIDVIEPSGSLLDPPQVASIRLSGSDAQVTPDFINPALFERAPTATLDLENTILLNPNLSFSGDAIFSGYRVTLETLEVPERPLTPIPLPAGLPLLLGALGAMGLAARRRAV